MDLVSRHKHPSLRALRINQIQGNFLKHKPHKGRQKPGKRQLLPARPQLIARVEI
jgi:hypothetical protein